MRSIPGYRSEGPGCELRGGGDRRKPPRPALFSAQDSTARLGPGLGTESAPWVTPGLGPEGLGSRPQSWMRILITGTRDSSRPQRLGPSSVGEHGREGLQRRHPGWPSIWTERGGAAGPLGSFVFLAPFGLWYQSQSLSRCEPLSAGGEDFASWGPPWPGVSPL